MLQRGSESHEVQTPLWYENKRVAEIEGQRNGGIVKQGNKNIGRSRFGSSEKTLAVLREESRYCEIVVEQ